MIKNTEGNDYFDKISFLFKKLDVKFSDLNPATEDSKKLFDYVYKNNNYQINAENIETMILEYSSEIEVK